MGGLTALIQSGTAIVAAVVALLLLRQGQFDRREVRRDKEREQARRVTAWADWTDSSELASLTVPRIPAVFVANSSDAVVFDVFVDYITPGDDGNTRRALGPLPPGTTRRLDVDCDIPPIPGWEPTALHPRVYFRDSAGRLWIRDALGRLRFDPGPGNDDLSGVPA